MDYLNLIFDHGVPALLGFIAILLGGAVAWTKMQAKVSDLNSAIISTTRSVKELADEVMKHHGRTEIHRDPVRDPERHLELLALIKDNKDSVMRGMSNIKNDISKDVKRIEDGITAVNARMETGFSEVNRRCITLHGGRQP